jgi:ribulose-phosphate 3-epimerase
MKAVICPTVTAFNKTQYLEQLAHVSEFASRVHIDLMDGIFAPTTSQSLLHSWWHRGQKVDLHVMYQKPLVLLDDMIAKHPNLVILHAESDDVSSAVHELHEHRIKVGIALLKETPVDVLHHFAKVIDHVLIFSGTLGHHGGTVDFSMLEKVRFIKEAFPHLEVGWDGGINDQNAVRLVNAGVRVLNVGGFIQKAQEPRQQYELLAHLLQ